MAVLVLGGVVGCETTGEPKGGSRMQVSTCAGAGAGTRRSICVRPPISDSPTAWFYSDKAASCPRWSP